MEKNKQLMCRSYEDVVNTGSAEPIPQRGISCTYPPGVQDRNAIAVGKAAGTADTATTFVPVL